MDPDVIGAVGHTVRLAAPKVRRDGSHVHCRPFVDKHLKGEVDSRQVFLFKVDVPHTAREYSHFRTRDAISRLKGVVAVTF